MSLRRSENDKHSWTEVERTALTSKPLVIAVAFILFFLAIWVILVTYQVALAGHVDFRHLYTAGYMVRAGEGARLYDQQRNEELQNRLVSSAPGGLTFNHLAYEALVYAPFSFLRYRQAYAASLLANLVVLAGTIRMLWPYFSPLGQIWELLPAAVTVCFLPVAFALAEGQDSLILLALVVASMTAVDQGKEFAGGALLGLTLFKFQYALPMAFLFLIWRRWRFLGGFAPCGALVGGLSLWLTGISGVRSYLPYLLSISSNYSDSEGVRHGIHPEGMANLRGLVASIGGGSALGILLVTLVLSASVIAWAGFKRPSLPYALLAATLVSYHHVISDTSLMVLPLGLLISGWKGEALRCRQLALLACLTFLAVPVLLFAGPHFYLLSVPLMVLSAVWDGTYLSPYRGGHPIPCPQKDTK